MNRTLLLAGLLAFAAFALVRVGHAQTQAEMTQRANDAADKADKALNAAYKDLLPFLDAEGKERLKKSQRAWLQFRDAECAFAADVARGGSMEPQLHAGTFQTLTEARTAQLRSHADLYKSLVTPKK